MDENQNNVTVGGENTQTTGTETKPMSFEEMLNSNKEYRQEFDRRMNKTVETTTKNVNENWETKLNNQKTEAERLATMTETEKLQYQLKKKETDLAEMQNKLNARDLKDEAFKIATAKETAFDPEFLNLFNFENMTAEQLQEKTKLIKSIQDRIVEKAVNEWTKEKPPYNPDPSGNKPSNYDEVRKIMGLK